MKLPGFSFRDESFWLMISTYGLPLVGILLYIIVWLFKR